MNYTKNILDSKVLLLLFFLFIAAVPRIPIVPATAGHSDSNGAWQAGVDWWNSGHYNPSRKPGAPVYEMSLGVLYAVVYKGLGFDKAKMYEPGTNEYYLFSNSLSVLCTAITLFFFFLILRHFFSFEKSILATALLNFYPHMLVMGATTSDVIFLVLFMVLAFYAYLEKMPRLAIIFALLGAGSRMQGLALVAPLVWEHLRNRFKKQDKYFFIEISWIALCTGLLFYPSIRAYGLTFFIQPYHKNIVGIKKLGAFIHRTFNLMGPIGTLTTAAILYRYRRKLTKIRPISQRNILVFYIWFFLFTMSLAPWESFYLLALVPLFIFIVFFYGSRFTILIFSASLLIGSFVQVHFKPWKWPPYRVLPGIVEAHLQENYIIRSGM
ncbi:MAG: hypothetical protein AB7F43_06420 [Bacteriovoracia bacterium]